MLKLIQRLKSYCLTFLFFLKIFLVDCQSGIGTFFTRKVHNSLEPILLDLGYWNVFRLKIILFCRYIFKKQYFFEDWHESVCKDILQRLENQNISEDQINLEVDVYQLNQISSDQFFQDYLLTGKPVVLKRGNLDNEDLFSDQYFLKHYGETKVVIDDIKTGKRFVKTLREYLSDNDPERLEYIRTSYDFTLENPDFVECLNPHQFDSYMSGANEKDIYVYSELFLGKSKKTGTSLHCANGNNLFFMIRGQKKWTFVHPDYTWLLYPLLNAPMRYVMSEIIPEVTSLPEVIDNIYPLWKYCPRYTIVLEPGDILLSPSWYWHTVENMTDMTMALATRWLPINKVTNRFFTFLQVFSQSNWQLVINLLGTEVQSSLNNENTLVGTESPDEKVGFGQIGQAKQIWNKKKQQAKQVLSAKTYQQYCLNLDPQHSENG
jgi:hypothetical protein